MASHRSYQGASRQQVSMYNTQQQQSHVDYQQANTQTQAADESQTDIDMIEDDIDVETGSFQEHRPYNNADTTHRERASTSNRRRTHAFVVENQRELGGARHKLSARSHRPRERRKSQARETLAAFDRRYQGSGQSNGGSARS